MRILILGAAGDVGRCVTAEALAKMHEVTAVVRTRASAHLLPNGVAAELVDVAHGEKLADLIASHDVVVSALRPSAGEEALLPEITRTVVDASASRGVRVIVVGGAARLMLPDQPGFTVLTAPGYLPAEILPIARASQEQYEVCVGATGAEWTYISPPAMLQQSERRGRYRVGGDTMLVDATGCPHISYQDFAVAIVDEIEKPCHIQEAFTVGY